MLYEIENLVMRRASGYMLEIRRLHIHSGDKIALIGMSGCGKSTTLDILGLNLHPDSADKFILEPQEGRPVAIMPLWHKNSLDALAALRLAYMGYVLQSGELLPYLSAGENMVLTARLSGLSNSEARETARKLAEHLNIESLWDQKPATLSVGQRQRVAIVRALASHPQIILADEPTAALDPLHADKVMDTFLEALNTYNSTLILVTHNTQWARKGGLQEVPFVLEEKDNVVHAILDNGR